MKKEQSENMHVIPGKNAVIESMLSGRTINSILITKRKDYKSMSRLFQMAKELKIPVKEILPGKLDSLSNGTAHQGVVAVCSNYKYSEFEDIFKNARNKQQDLFIIIADGIMDPHNLGAIIRTADCVGAHGVIIHSRHAVGLTPVVEKTSAGAVSYVPVVRVINIVNIIEDLKKKGLWIFGAEAGSSIWCDVDLKGPLAIVVGSEGKGISRLVKEKCDSIVSLPLNGEIKSLNVSVAAGVFMYEVLRQRMQSKKGEQM